MCVCVCVCVLMGGLYLYFCRGLAWGFIVDDCVPACYLKYVSVLIFVMSN